MNNEKNPPLAGQRQANQADQELVARVFSDDVQGEAMDFPLVEPPESLTHRLHKIPDVRHNQPTLFGQRLRLPALAAAILSAVFLGAFYQNVQQREQALDAAQQMRTAFQYLQQSHEMAAEKTNSTLRETLQRATLKPVFQTVDNLNT